MPQRESERLFDESIGTAIEQIRALQDIELVIGIPFYNETQTLLEMLEIINTQLADYLTDKKNHLHMFRGSCRKRDPGNTAED